MLIISVKHSGIPRARIYDILESLTLIEGLLMFEENRDGTKNYTALPVKVFLEQARERNGIVLLIVLREELKVY